MDYNLAALKVLSSQLTHPHLTTTSTTPPSLTLFGILFQRAWLQGVLVSASAEGGRFLLDDGAGIVELHLSNESHPHNWITGMYVMIVGMFVPAAATADFPLVKVHKIVDLSSSPDREAMWHLEVIEAYKLFYLPSLQ